jgi:isopenicillin N synthase-like dioxygenase
VAAKYHDTSRKALAGRLAGLTAKSEQKQAELQRVAVEAKRRFDAEWGIQGQKYKELREGLQRATAVGKQSFSNTMQQGSDIEMPQKAKIDKVKSLKQANKLAEEMPGEIITATMNNWARICDQVQQRCIALLGPFAEALDDIGAPVDLELSDFSDGAARDKFKREYFTMFRSAAGGGMMVMSMTGMASIAGVSVVGLLGAAAPFVAVPVLAVLVGGGLKGALSGQVKTAQQQLKMQLAEQLQKVRRHFFDVDLSEGSFSRVEEYFATLDRTVNEHVRELAQKKSTESQAEIACLKEAMQLEGREREARTRQTQEQLAKWDEVGKTLGAVTNQIKALQRPAAPAKAPAGMERG